MSFASSCTAKLLWTVARPLPFSNGVESGPTCASQRIRTKEPRDIPIDEDSLIRQYSLLPADLLEIKLRRREHNQLGIAIQPCLMRYPGRPPHWW
ncbi:MAG: DUF4158 domain-containing protein [Nitratireductor sp.]|nr:DUF4158 domain-containing protein [Nitratireductor arenosus]